MLINQIKKKKKKKKKKKGEKRKWKKKHILNDSVSGGPMWPGN